MIIKSPVCYDVSHYKIIPDFALIEPKPVLFITKATEAFPNSGYNHTDEKFLTYFPEMMKINTIRGCYHFFRGNLNSIMQARHFAETISKIDILPTDILILDVEDGITTASQMWAWFEFIKASFPNNRRMLYSRKNILDPIYMTASEKEYFKKIDIWTAGYPFYSDLFSTVPTAYIPDRTKYGPTKLWQYSSHGSVAGIIGDVDLNWISPEFYNELGDNMAGEIIPINITGVCEETAKVFATIGGVRIYPDVRINQSIKGDAKQTVSGILYIHLTSPIIGWSKGSWFTYTEAPISTEPPPPTVVKVPFTLNVEGYKTYTGELEKL